MNLQWRPSVLQILFMVGYSKSETINKVIQEENEEFQDLIFGDFEDSYRNLPLKTFSGYTYLNTYCSLTANKWIMFQDDDTFVDHLELMPRGTNYIV